MPLTTDRRELWTNKVAAREAKSLTSQRKRIKRNATIKDRLYAIKLKICC